MWQAVECLSAATALKETFCKRRTEVLKCRDLKLAQLAKREAWGRDLLPLRKPHGLIKRVQNEVAYQRWIGANAR